MLKFLGGMCILAAAGAVRAMQVRSMQRERSTLYGLAAALEEMGNEIRVNRTPLPRLLKKTGKNSGADVNAFFISASAALERGEWFLAAWNRAAEALPLAAQERAAIRELGRSLCGDEQQACQGVELTCENLRRTLQEKRQSTQEQEKRVTAVCFSGAAFLIILLM